MKALPLVTIAIPFYNNEHELPNAIRSILCQTFDDWELILIDDGSSDGSLKIAKSINDPRVMVISDGVNKKLPARLNQIVDLAKGEYIARMDADDLCSPDRIQKQLEVFRQDPSLDVVGTGVIFLDDDNVPMGKSIVKILHDEICATPHRLFRLCHASILARRSWYLQNRYDERARLVEDYKLWLESYEKSKFRNVPDFLYYYRSESSFSRKKEFIGRVSLMRLLYQHYCKKNKPMAALYYSSLQIAKMVVGPVICLLSSKRKLIEKRYNHITAEEKQFYGAIIKSIEETELPSK